MSHLLPERPNLQQLHKRAKDLLSSHRAYNPGCCQVLRHLKQFAGKTDLEILDGQVSLVEVQYAVALDYGFGSWQELVAAVAGGDPGKAPVVESGRRLETLAWVPRVTTHLGCLQGCAKHLGMELSPGWLFGGSGHAFVLCVAESLCPSGPHSWNWGVEIPRLSRNLGLAIQMQFTRRSQPDLAQRQQATWDGVRQAIDQGRPAYGWHYEFFVINGYTHAGYQFSGPGEAPTDWREFGDMTAPGFVSIATVDRTSPADDEVTVRETVAFATQRRTLEQYDSWIRGLESSGEVSSDGAAYHAAVWLECRRFGVEFLREADVRTGGKHGAALQEAAGQYAVVVDRLREVSRLFGPGTRKQNARNLEDHDRRCEAAEHLRQAKRAEEAGLAAMRRML